MYNLGVMYYTGTDIEKNIQKGINWLEKGSAAADDRALLFLGRIYAAGDGVPKDACFAVELFEHAAEWGNYEAMLELVDRYERGDGAMKSHKKAMEWKRKAEFMAQKR